MMRPPPMDPRTVRPIEIVPHVQVIPHQISQPKDIPPRIILLTLLGLLK